MISVLGLIAFQVLGGPSPVIEHGVRYLENHRIRLGVDLDKGGSITFLSKIGGVNIVNSCDLGRQIQMSFYSGPIPFAPNGKQPAKTWRELGWNPIQTGDTFGNPSQVLEFRSTGNSLYVKCIPMHWPLDNVPGECTFEEWIRLDGIVAQVKDRLVMNRPDKTQYPARDQELPAIYTNGPWYRLMAYTGNSPFSNGDLSELTNTPPNSTFPWVGFHATEGWAALLDKHSFGVGIVEPGTVKFSGGFFGKPGSGGPKDSPTGYIAPNAVEILDWNAVYDSQYELVVGSLDEIRRRAYLRVPRPKPPHYRFSSNRQHWSYVNCEDYGWPIRGALELKLEKDDPQLVGPEGFWLAKDAPNLVIEAAYSTHGGEAQVFWSRSDAPGFTQQRSVRLEVIPDGKFHRYVANLGACPEYKGIITKLRVDPEDSGASGDVVRIKSISFR